MRCTLLEQFFPYHLLCGYSLIGAPPVFIICNFTYITTVLFVPVVN